MKAKVILTSTAVLGLLTACSQDELGVIENNAPVKATTAPIAGKAVIKWSDNSTRFNKEAGLFENPRIDPETGKEIVDQIGLYQMDRYMFEYDVEDGEYRKDANTPEDYWRYQPTWWKLHRFINNINTNYKYTYKDGQFVNPGAELVEGNYFLLFDPETDVNSQGHKPYANRRDLWKAISKEVVLNNYTNTNYNKAGFGGLYGTLDNQFYLDYQQIYRNDETLNEDGELIINAQLKPVLGKYTVDLVNESHTAYRFKEIRIYPKGNGFVPNIAYVRPAGFRNTLDGTSEQKLKDTLLEMYPEYYPTGEDAKKAFTQEMARSIVEYADVTSGYVPYGYEGDDNIAAYYSIKFEEPAVIEAHEGSATLAQALEAIFVAPIWPDFEESQIVVYADKYDILAEVDDADEKTGQRGAWVAGYFVNDKKSSDNKKWTVERTFDQVNKGRLYFDDNFFHTYASSDKVQNTKDLINQVTAILESGWMETIEATLDGDGIEINEELNTLINRYEKKYGKQITLQIKPNGHDITLADKDMLNDGNEEPNFDLLYPKKGTNTIIITKDQKLENDWTMKNFTVEGDVEIDLNGHRMGFVTVNVNGKVTLPSSGIINGIVNGEMVVEEKAIVEVGNSGLTNTKTGTITVEGALQEKSAENKNAFTNDGTVVVAETGEVTITDGKGFLDVSAVVESTSGEQNHIEVVKKNEITVIDSKVTYGDYRDIQKRLEKILAAHNLTDVEKFKSIEVTSSAKELKNTCDKFYPVAEWADIVSLKMSNEEEVALNSATGDFSKLAKLTLANGAVVPSSNTLKAKNLEIDGKLDVRAVATVEVTTQVELNADIKLYENAKLAGTPSVTGDGKVYGYDDQIDWELSDDVKQGNE